MVVSTFRSCWLRWVRDLTGIFGAGLSSGLAGL